MLSAPPDLRSIGMLRVRHPPPRGTPVSWRFNPPPGWPTQPEGWIPPPSWAPDPTWPPAPPGWQFWVPDDAPPSATAGLAAAASPPAEPTPAAPPTQPARPTQPPRPRRRRLLFAALAAVVVVALAGAVPTWGVAVPTMLSRLGDDPEGTERAVATPAPILTRVGELFPGTGAPPDAQLAVGELAGDPVAVASNDDQLLVVDLATAELLPARLTDRKYVTALAVGELAGTPIAVTGRLASDQDGEFDLRVWDLAARDPVGEPLTGHTDMVTSIAIGELAGDAVVVSGSLDGELRVWDLTTGEQIGDPLTGHSGRIHQVAVAELAGGTAAVSSDSDGTLRIWDLTTGEQVTRPTDDRGPGPRVSTLAIGELDGEPIAVTDGRWPVALWDLATGEEIGEELGTDNSVTSIAYTTLDGTPVAIAGYDDGAIRVWDLATVASWEPTSEPLVGELPAGHTSMVTSLAVSELAGDPVVVSSSVDGRTFVWRLG